MFSVRDSHINWRKSRRSDNGGANCVEIAAVGPAVAVRDSKDPQGGALTFSPSAWRTFAERVKGGGHDLR
ncbi:DUF397 domain-containing protein [Spirillospora sp. NPDC029432]|uniref:DUF397 domain-containing protein n=1 Tax=Spirillospora sp. NPDC029432 TaxID=3154599 RepID=UPI003456C797